MAVITRSNPLHHLLQEVFILATGSAANATQLQALEAVLGPQGDDYKALMALVDSYMSDRVANYPDSVHGVEELLKATVHNGLGLQLDGAQTTALLQALMGQGISTWGQWFALCVTLENETGRVLDQRATAAQGLVDALGSVNKGGLLTGELVTQAVKTHLQSIGASSTSLLLGQNGLSVLVDQLSAAGLESTVADGYLSGATVFVDANSNGQIDPGEYRSTTDTFGNFVLPLDASAGRIVAFGGFDIMTVKPFQGVLTAPVGATVVNPLTTLVQTLVASGLAGSVQEASEWVRAALGLPNSIHLLSYDPLAVLANTAASASERAEALSVQAKALQVANIVSQAGAALSGAQASPVVAASEAVVQALAQALSQSVSQSNGLLDLAQADVLASILRASAEQLGAPAVLTAADAIAQVIAASNRATASATTLAELARVAVVTQGDAASALAKGDFASAANGSTGFVGAALDQRISGSTTGDLVPGVPVVPVVPVAPAEPAAPPPAFALTIDVGGDAWINVSEASKSTPLHATVTSSTLSAIKVSGAYSVDTKVPAGSVREVTAVRNATTGHYEFDALGFAQGSLSATASDIYGQTLAFTLTLDTELPTASAWVATSTMVGATSTEAGTLGLYSGSTLLGAAGGGSLRATLNANTAGSLAVEAQTMVTAATLKVVDTAGNADNATRSVVLGTIGPDAALQGTPDADILYGFGGDDTLQGGLGVDVLYGGDGDDILTGGDGADMLNGGDGEDTFLITSAAHHSSTESITGGQGVDMVRWTSTGGATLTLSAYVDVDDVRISAADGATGGTTSESVNASAVAGAINIYGNAGNNTLTGNAHTNTLEGQDGDDTLISLGGADRLFGGGGNDNLRFSSGAELAAAAIVDGGAGTDIITWTAPATDIDDADFAKVAGDSIEKLQLSNGTNSVQLGPNAALATINLVVIGGTGADTLNAGQLAEDIHLGGGIGDDTMLGGSGADTLTGGAGIDELTGGAGVDTFAFPLASDSAILVKTTSGKAEVLSIDRLMDFVSGTDKLDLAPIATLYQGSAYTAEGIEGDLAAAINNAIGASDYSEVAGNTYVVTITGINAGVYIIQDTDGNSFVDQDEPVIQLAGTSSVSLLTTDFI